MAAPPDDDDRVGVVAEGVPADLPARHGDVFDMVRYSLADRDVMFEHPASYLAGVREACRAAEPLVEELVARRVASELALIVHELRTPVAVIVMATDSLEEHDGALSDHQRQRLRDMSHQRVHELDILLSRLASSTEGAGSFDVEVGPMELRSITGDLMDELGAISDHHPIVRHLDGPPCTVVADSLAVRRILVALVSNAVKYSPQSTPVEVALDVDGAYASLTVSDQGHGIAPADLERIFAKGVRGGDGTEGHGLGLYLARGLARAQAGDVTVDPRVDGAGAVFRLQLPLAATVTGAS